MSTRPASAGKPPSHRGPSPKRAASPRGARGGSSHRPGSSPAKGPAAKKADAEKSPFHEKASSTASAVGTEASTASCASAESSASAEGSGGAPAPARAPINLRHQGSVAARGELLGMLSHRKEATNPINTLALLKDEHEMEKNMRASIHGGSEEWRKQRAFKARLGEMLRSKFEGKALEKEVARCHARGNRTAAASGRAA